MEGSWKGLKKSRKNGQTKEKCRKAWKKHLGGNWKKPLSSHRKPEKWEICGKRKDRMDAGQQNVGKISCQKNFFLAASDS